MSVSNVRDMQTYREKLCQQKKSLHFNNNERPIQILATEKTFPLVFLKFYLFNTFIFLHFVFYFDIRKIDSR